MVILNRISNQILVNMIYVVNKHDIMIFISVETPTETTTVAGQGNYIIFLRWISKFENDTIMTYIWQIFFWHLFDLKTIMENVKISMIGAA